jgi:hypothetical protein
MSTVKKYTHRIKGVFRQAGFSPRADWTIVLFVFATLLVLITVTSTLVFMKLSTESLTQAPQEGVEVPTIDRDMLRETVRYFEERAVSASPLDSVLVDPSR